VTPAGVGLIPGSRFQSLRSSLGGRRITILAGAVAAFSAAATVGDLLSPVFLERCPLALVVLNPRTGYLIALARAAPLPVFLVASVVRLCAADPLYFLLGRAAGPAVISAGHQVRGLRRLPDRLADRVPSRSSWLWLAAVAASPTAKTMLVAGGGGLPAGGVAAANVTGTLVRVLLVWRVGTAFPTVGETVAALAPWIAVPACVMAVALAAVRFLAPRSPKPPGRECRPRAGRPGSAGVRCAG
jgi:hypothetical protein